MYTSEAGTLAALALDGTVRWQTNLVQGFGRDSCSGPGQFTDVRTNI